jgi:hypothetical protein
MVGGNWIDLATDTSRTWRDKVNKNRELWFPHTGVLSNRNRSMIRWVDS